WAVGLYGLLIFLLRNQKTSCRHSPGAEVLHSEVGDLPELLAECAGLAVLEKAGTIPAIYSQSGRMSTGTGTPPPYSGDEESAGFVSGGGGSGAKRVVSLQSIRQLAEGDHQPQGDMVHDAIHIFIPQPTDAPRTQTMGAAPTAPLPARSSNSSSKYGTADSSADQASRPTGGTSSTEKAHLLKD
uniref:Cadherin_C domain-containing protein n=1 Tax=Macrostomum lignano TaxID=282301 RepID=A0A1I8F7J4_9PLAT